MIKMHISLEGIQELEGNLDRIHDIVSGGFEPELKEIGDWYLNFLTNDVFETEGAVYRTWWPNLQPAYAKRKAEKYPGRGILEASGTMRKSWKLYTSAHYALIENETDYAIYHQEGRGVPKRMLVSMDNERRDIINEMFKEGILRRIQDAFKR